QQRLARQLDAVLIVDGDHFDLHDVADLADAFDLVHVLVVELADVAEAVAAGEDLDEGAEVLDRSDTALVDLADLDLLGDGFDLGLGGFGAGGVDVRDVYRAVVVDVDLGAGHFLNALDVLAAGTDEGADLFGVDAHDQQPWRSRADFASWEAQG